MSSNNINSGIESNSICINDESSIDSPQLKADEFDYNDEKYINLIRQKYNNDTNSIKQQINEFIEEIVYDDGRKMYININDGEKKIFIEKNWKCFFELPIGYEAALNNEGYVYFIDHINKCTTNTLPYENREMINLSKNINIKSTTDTKFSEDLTLTFNLPKKLKTSGITTFKFNNNIVVEKISLDSPFNEKLYAGDIIRQIDGMNLNTDKDIMYTMKNKTNVQFSITRIKDESGKLDGIRKIVKPAIKSIERENYLKQNPARVHFSEAPIVINYEMYGGSNCWDTVKIDSTCNNIIKVFLPDGTFRTLRFKPNEYVWEIARNIVKNLGLPHENCFTLALLPRGSTDINYFGLDDNVYSIIKKKCSMDQTECFLLMYSFPHKIRLFWSEVKYESLINFIFQQFRLFLLTARFRNVFIIPNSDLNQLIALSATVDFIVSKAKLNLNKYSSQSSTFYNCNTQNNNIINNNMISLEKSYSKSKIIRLSTLQLEQHPIFPPYSTLQDLRKDLDNYHITSLMINSFDIITPDNIKILSLGDKNTSISIDLSGEKTEQKINETLQKAQLCFIESCMECRISPVSRYRVNIIYRTKKPTSNIVINNNIPQTIAITYRTIDIHNDDSVQNLFNISDIYGIICSMSNDENNGIINIFGKNDNVISIRISLKEFRSFVWMISAVCNEFWRDDKNIRVPIFDLSNIEYRSEIYNMPSYDNIHIVLPSKWNYSGNYNNLFTSLKFINTMNEEKLNRILPYLMLYDNKEEENKSNLYFNPIFKYIHLKYKSCELIRNNESIPIEKESLNGLQKKSSTSIDDIDDIIISDLSKKVLAANDEKYTKLI